MKKLIFQLILMMNPVFVALVALRADLRVAMSARYVTRPLWIAYFTRKLDTCENIINGTRDPVLNIH